jgi:hypothetical protein
VDLFFLLIIVIFIIGPIIEKAMKGGAAQRPQQGQPLPGQRPPPRRVQQRFPQIPAPEPVEGGGAHEDATDILPADLWEMLTGQRPSSTGPMRTGPAPTPERPAPERPPPERVGRLTRTTDWEQSRAASATPPPEKLRDDRAEADALIRERSRVEAERRALHRGPPEIVSLETPVASQRVRHEAFHKRLDAKGGGETAKVDKPAGARLRMDHLAMSELQRAVLLREILGKPKALDPE